MGSSGRYSGWVPAQVAGDGNLSIGAFRVGTEAGNGSTGSPIDSDSLLASARRHALRGMRSRAAAEHDDAALQMGVMLEHLAKAYLAGLHPTLLVDNKFDLLSLVALAGQGQQVTVPHIIRTIGLQGALERIGMLRAGGLPGAGVAFARQFDTVAQARNGVAHVGTSEREADEVAQVAIRGADEILQMMGVDLEVIFGEYVDAAVSLLDEASTALEQMITLRLGHARQVFATRLAGYGQDDEAEELASLDRIAALQAEDDDRKAAHLCPACEHTGFLVGTPYLEVEPGEHFTDSDGGEMVLVSLRVLLSADGFRCPICDLRLRGVEQLREVPLPTSAVVRLGNREDLATFADAVRFSSHGDEGDEGEDSRTT